MIDKKTLDEVVSKLKAEHDELHLLTAAGQQVIVRPPRRPEFIRFKEMAAGDERKKAQASETLLRSCVVHPDPEALDQMLQRKPGLGVAFGAELLEMAGAVDEVEAKKL